jgi:hypothetical protein
LDLKRSRDAWLAALTEAEAFVREWPQEEYGCLYYSTLLRQFVPRAGADLAAQEIVPHFGAPGGAVPRMADARVEGIG